MDPFFIKSRIFLYFCLSFALGILSASFLTFPVLFLSAAVIISITFISIFWHEKKFVIICFCIIFVILGIYRFQSVAEKTSFIAGYNDRPEKVILEGIVVEEPDVRIGDTQYVVQVQSPKSKVALRQAQGDNNVMVSLSNHSNEENQNSTGQNLGKVLVTLPHYPEYQYGDLIEMEGKLKTPAEFEAFSYKDYLAKDGIFSVMYSPDNKLISSGNGNFAYSAIFRVKSKFKKNLKSVLPEPENSLLAGLLLGERSGLSQEIKDDFSVTGTSHIIAVSGFNVTIIAIIILELALILGFSRGQSFWISLAAIFLFIIMVGAPASAVRAGIMGGLVLVAVRAGRLNSMTNAITFAAVVMMAINPKILRFDAGFQLSFLAVIGLVWLCPILEEYLKKIPDHLKIKSMLIVTISAQIMALPVLLYDFERLSLVSPVANILILPLVPLAMGLGFVSGIFSFIWFPMAKIVGYFTWLVLNYQIHMIEFLSDRSWAAVEIRNFDGMFLVLYYLIIAVIVVNNYNKKKEQFSI